MPTPLPPSTTVPKADRFPVVLAHLLRTEGGYNNIPGDRGGPTNFGISLRFAIAESRVDAATRRLLDMDMDGDVDHIDIRRLSRAAAAAVYRRCFWDRYRCAELAPPIDGALFDQAVNGGGVAAVRMLQEAVNSAYRQVVVTPDGVIGPRTIRHANKLMPEILIANYRGMVEARYREIVRRDPVQRKFLAGWLNRTAALGTV